VVDTTGAGDCLAGWFVAGRLRGAIPRAALETAVVAATMSCSQLGAQTSYPTLHDVIVNGGLIP
jgi:ribokinase